jgi:hypothetical protein
MQAWKPWAAAVLTAFAATTAPLSARAAGWTTFIDPSEHAFTAEVPQGWLVQGGMERKSDTNVMGWLALASQDGSTTVFIHDPNIPLFVLPNQQRREGTWAVNGALGLAAVFPYAGGAQFAAKYGQKAFASACGNLQLKGTQSEPDLVQRQIQQYRELAAAVGATGAGVPQIDAGSALFNCQIKGKPYVAGVIATTSLSPGVPVGNAVIGGSWNAIVMGYRAPVEDQADADRLVRYISASFRQDPQFRAKMIEVTQGKLAEIRANGERGMAMLRQMADRENAALRQQYESSMRTQQESHDAFMNMMDQQEADRNYQFDNHMQQKAIGQFNEMLYINNQHCDVYYNNDPHQGCHYYSNN